MSLPFGVRLQTAMAQFGSLCVGLDPHPNILQQWGLPASAEGLNIFSSAVLDACLGHVAAVKPQAALYEEYGSAGIAVLESVIDRVCRVESEVRTQCIVDAKRGDIGSTMAAYGRAYCVEGSPLAGDAVTLSPYLGFGSLQPALELALANRRGAFILALTSNPEGPSVQHARTETGSVAGDIVEAARSMNDQERRESSALGWGSIGLVVGATVGSAITQLDLDFSDVGGALLAPGFGAQGATVQDLRVVFGCSPDTVLASSSRGVLAHGPDVDALRHAAIGVSDELRVLMR